MSQVRSSDFISRYAGDEFVAILQVGPEEVGELVGRIQKAVDRRDFGSSGSSIFIGVSAGWATFGIDGDTLDELLLSADRAMYQDKARRKTPPGEAENYKPSELNQFRVM